MMVKLMVDTFIKSFLLSEALVFILGIFKILSFKVLTFAIEVSTIRIMKSGHRACSLHSY